MARSESRVGESSDVFSPGSHGHVNSSWKQGDNMQWGIANQKHSFQLWYLEF